MLRRNDLPNRFQYRGEELLFHRLADGPALGRLDPYADGEQVWPMLNGHDIAVTAEEIRDITLQVYGITLPPLDPLKARVVELEARVAKLEAREPAIVEKIVEVEKIVHVEVPAPVVEPDPPAAPYVPDFTLIPDALAKYAEADESAEDFRARAFSLLFRFGINDGEHFEGAGPLTADEKIMLLPMLVANFEAGNWLGLTEDMKP